MSSHFWHIEPGKLEHRAAPGLQARWQTGPEALEAITGLCWSDDGLSEDESIHVYAIEWSGAPPDQAGFERLMDEAVSAIDQWIRARM